MTRTLIAVCLMSLALPSPAQAGDDPIYIGGDQNSDACKSVGEIVGLDPHGDGFLSVRSGPGGRGYSEIDRVYNGDKVNVCDRAGDWFAVIYDHHGSDCDVHRPRSVRQAYTGPCQAGWVFRRYVATVGSAPLPVAQANPPSDSNVCESLWRQRNAIYQSAGFCFKTARAVAVFGNSACSYDSIGDVPLSENQRRAVAGIVSEERSFACSQ